MTNIINFEEYVKDFYNESNGVYPIKGLTNLMIKNAVKKHINKVGCWFEGDSIDREGVREIILNDMKNTIKLKDLKQGEYFKRKETSQKVFIRQHFNRKNQWGPASIWCGDSEAIGDGIELNPNTIVFINFEY